MIIQITNVAAGFVLAAPKLKTFGAKEQIENLEQKLTTFRGTIGVVELVLGVIAFLERFGILWLDIPFFGASYPQALVAVVMGLILSANLFEKYPVFHEKIKILKENAEWIGLAGIAVGLFSII